MTDPTSASTPVEDITDGLDAPSGRLERQTDAILLETEAPDGGVRPLRKAIREDAALARDWGRRKASGVRTSVEAEPVKATLYALGLGVVIGLLIAR